jgi:hypothetical protein
MSEQKSIYAMTWFQPDEWLKLKEVVDDPSSLDDSYLDWKVNAEVAIREIRESGQQVRKISIKVNKLLDWCQENGVRPDGKARSEYAAYLAQERDLGK